MKATGIVRRVEARVIITQKCNKTLYIIDLWKIFKKNFRRKQQALRVEMQIKWKRFTVFQRRYTYM